MPNKRIMRGWGWTCLLLSLPRASSWRSIVRQPTMSSLQHHVSTKFGNMYYRKLGNLASGDHALFIHGLGSDSSTCSPSQKLLDKMQWIIPDLVGHGMSCKPVELEAYTMQSQASFIHKIVSEQQVKDLFVIGHSLGGPVAIKLCEKINREEKNMSVRCLVYEEGNINEDDCFGSKKILDKGCPLVGPDCEPREATDFAM
eukprot:750994-Hanusia_phi.AAC.1